MAVTPRIAIKSAVTTNVYGRRSASLIDTHGIALREGVFNPPEISDSSAVGNARCPRRWLALLGRASQSALCLPLRLSFRFLRLQSPAHASKIGVWLEVGKASRSNPRLTRPSAPSVRPCWRTRPFPETGTNSQEREHPSFPHAGGAGTEINRESALQGFDDQGAVDLHAQLSAFGGE